jgi:hypothetical protein
VLYPKQTWHIFVSHLGGVMAFVEDKGAEEAQVHLLRVEKVPQRPARGHHTREVTTQRRRTATRGEERGGIGRTVKG